MHSSTSSGTSLFPLVEYSSSCPSRLSHANLPDSKSNFGNTIITVIPDPRAYLTVHERDILGHTSYVWRWRNRNNLWRTVFPARPPLKDLKPAQHSWCAGCGTEKSVESPSRHFLSPYISSFLRHGVPPTCQCLALLHFSCFLYASVSIVKLVTTLAKLPRETYNYSECHLGMGMMHVGCTAPVVLSCSRSITDSILQCRTGIYRIQGVLSQP